MTVDFSPRAKRRKPFQWGQCILHIVFIAACLTYILPFLLVVSISLSNEADLIKYGYSLIPRNFTTLSYRAVFKNPTQIVNSYLVTAEFSLLSMGLMLLVQSMCAYAISRTNFKYRKAVTFLLFFTMLFSGGLIPWYMTISKVGLIDNFWALILPSAVSVYNVIILMNFFRQLPQSVLEAAYIDGASHFRTLFQVVVPMSLPSIATLTLFSFVTHWNSWFDGLLLMNSPANYPLQSYLQTVIVNRDMSLMSTTDILTSSLVSDSTSKAAQTFVAALPVMIIYPFLQKYFAAGIQLGSVKE